MLITDGNGDALGYLPVNLKAGEESTPILIKITPTSLGERLRASSGINATIWARIHPAGAWIDINAAPMSLDPYYGSTQDFDIKIVAGAIVGSTRAALYFGASSGGAAGYLA